MDRNAYLGDPAFVQMPIAAMLSPAYAEAWRKTITPGHATDSASLQRPRGFLPPPPAEGVNRISEKPETTHFSVMDAEGNAVAVTTTLNGGFGSDETLPKFGFLLNDEMDDFTSKQGVPNMFGLIQGPANAIAPGKRPLSSMTPTILLAKDGTVRMVLGSPGGSRIISTVANILLSVDEGGLNIQSAVDAPRFHNQYQPNALSVEPHFAPSIVASLQQMGYDVKVSPYEWSDGECIERDPGTGVLTGGHDHRHEFGKAEGY
jgi:gamma-glutamyltranspeptidase/glutathione hydrolase